VQAAEAVEDGIVVAVRAEAEEEETAEQMALLDQAVLQILAEAAVQEETIILAEMVLLAALE
jgi:hypothetical protein